MAMKIKKGDMVQVMTGKDCGRRGKVLQVLSAKGRVVVEGLNMVKKHQKSGPNREAGIVDQEASLHISNVMLIDPSDDKPARVGFTIKDGRKYRISRRTGQIFE